MNPKVFVSHASEDKARFVVPFATALRSRGIDAWVDQWEMLPGDSLVDKIFEEGLKEAAAVILILSEVSIAKPWVREELNAAVVGRIEKGTKLIPIVLDRCEVPQALRSTVWESVVDTSNFETCLNRVVDSVFGHTTKPPIGDSPAYYSAGTLPTIGRLSAPDNLVLAKLYEVFVSQGRVNVDPEIMVAAMKEKGLDLSMVHESLEVLEHQGYIELLRHLGHGPYSSRITSYGISATLGLKEDELIRRVGFCIINEDLRRTDQIAAAIGLPESLVEHSVKQLEGSGHLMASKPISGPKSIVIVNPTLRRILMATD